jgi:DNA-binding MurR/RpiR family transcriptional regulator
MTRRDGAVPADLEALRQAITARYDDLSPKLRQIGRFMLDHPNEVALATVTSLAEHVAAQPSALIRFSQAFGYSGFSEMQALFRDSLVARSPSYSQRLRQLGQDQDPRSANSPLPMLRGFCAANVISLEHLADSIDQDQLEEAIHLMARARCVYLMAQRRSFPVAAYLAYALPHAERPAHLLNGLGGLLYEQAKAMSRQDVLISISFSPYSEETIQVTEEAAARRVPVIGISDSSVSPLKRHAAVYFEIKDAEVKGFRSLTASLCLAQVLAIGAAGDQGDIR